MSRQIEARHRGQQHGFIRRLFSPGDVGERLKPFVFLDYVHAKLAAGSGFGFHPHSGIATLTYQLNADVAYEDTAGQKGLVQATGLEWMRAAGGTWHQAQVHPHAELTEGFQLWLAMPPGVEDGPPEGIYVAPADVPQVGPVRVLLGNYQGIVHPIAAPYPVSYLDVVLAAGESWTFTPPPEQTVAWAFVYRGSVAVSGQSVPTGDLVVFSDGSEPLTFDTGTGARILFGSAAPHRHPLVLGSHSVHTSVESLRRGEAKIRQIASELRRDGRL
jgi:redox-sensitive bicupin YhaK (pirin superfamily)